MKAVTSEASFGRIKDGPLFQVNPNMPVGDALTMAACLAESIKSMAATNVDLGESETYLIAFVADAIQALCNAAEVGIA